MSQHKTMEIRSIAIQVGDLLKYSTTANEIDRAGSSILKVKRLRFNHESITSIRAQGVYDWLMSILIEKMNHEIREMRVVKFCRSLSVDELEGDVLKILADNGVSFNIVYKDSLLEFQNRNYHRQIHSHSKKLFLQQNYFHAVFEAAKSYNHEVKKLSNSNEDGQSMMMYEFGSNGSIKLNSGISDTGKSVQQRIMFLSSGFMETVRN